VTSSCFFPLLR